MRLRFLLVGLACLAGAQASPPIAAAAPARSASARASSFDALVAKAKAEMLANSSQALQIAREAQTVAEQGRPGPERVMAIATAQWLEAQALMRLNSVREATGIAREALNNIERFQPRSKLHGDLLMTVANGEGVLGRTQDALKDFQAAYNMFHAINETRSQAIALQYIGSIYLDASDYERALYYYGQSADVFPHDPQLLLTSRNNRGIALGRLGRFKEAEAEFRLALQAARQLHSPLLQAPILNNIARAEIANGEFAAAHAGITQGLRLAAVPGAEGWRPLLQGTAAELAFKQGNTSQAVRFLREAFEGKDLTKTTEDYREVHQTAYRVYKAAGDASEALAQLEAFQRLDDKARALTASTSAALMAARFDFTNQNLRIAKLKAGQLQRDVALSRAKAHQTFIIFSALMALAVAIVSLLALNMRSIRRSRNQIRAANDNLTETNIALEKALLAKTQFLATTSHEIRTPLNGILGMTQVMLADRNVAPEMRERVALVHGAGETMRALVDDILDIAKMETGHLETHRAEMDLASLLRQTVTFWEGQAQAKGLGISLALSADTPRRIVEDEARLKQILFNLMANGIKFTQEGAVTLHASVEKAGESERLVLAVEDSGIGIPESAFEDIFDKFKQLDGGTNRRFGGTGLGLAICRNLAIALGGEIGVRSEVGVGSTFTLRLPLHRVAAPEPATAPAESEGSKAGLEAFRLVLAGANPLAQSVLRATLEKQVAHFDIAADWTDAGAQAGPETILLVDGGALQAEGEEGMARLRALAGDARAGGARIVLLWPAPDEAMRAALMECGVEQVIAKPVTGAELIRQLRDLIAPCAKEQENIAQVRIKPAA